MGTGIPKPIAKLQVIAPSLNKSSSHPASSVTLSFEFLNEASGPVWVGPRMDWRGGGGRKVRFPQWIGLSLFLVREGNEEPSALTRWPTDGRGRPEPCVALRGLAAIM